MSVPNNTDFFNSLDRAAEQADNYYSGISDFNDHDYMIDAYNEEE